jgi:hypothetical protein
MDADVIEKILDNTKQREINLVNSTCTVALSSGFKDDSMDYLIEKAKMLMKHLQINKD